MEILKSEMGFWSAFTIVFILVAMGYFVVKMVQLSGKKQVPLDTTTDNNDQEK